MTKDDLPQFITALAHLVEVYNERMTPGRVEAYFKSCEDLSIGAVERGMDAALKTCTRFPRPAEIRQLTRNGRPTRPLLSLPAPGDGVSDPFHAREAFALHREIAGTRMPPAERLKRFVVMARKWPSRGWEDAVRQTEALVVAAERKASHGA